MSKRAQVDRFARIFLSKQFQLPQIAVTSMIAWQTYHGSLFVKLTSVKNTNTYMLIML